MNRMSACDFRLRDCLMEYIGIIERLFQYSSFLPQFIADMPQRQDRYKYLE